MPIPRKGESSEYLLYGFFHHSLSIEIKVVDKKCFHGDLTSKHLYLYIFIPQVVSLDSMLKEGQLLLSLWFLRDFGPSWQGRQSGWMVLFLK